MRTSHLPLLALCVGFGITPALAGERPTLVELFTSEGCSSCPPADAILAELANRPGVLALSLHVDYWDGPGWKDPFSSPAATARQERYAKLLGLTTVYTPQMVIDGSREAVGSRHAEIDDALEAARRDQAALPMTMTIAHGRAQIRIARADSPVTAAVLLIGFDRRHVTAVAGGENGGRTLTDVDVVRGIAEIGMFRGAAIEIAAPLPSPSDRVAAIVQAADGRVLAIAVGDAAPP